MVFEYSTKHGYFLCLGLIPSAQKLKMSKLAQNLKMSIFWSNKVLVAQWKNSCLVVGYEPNMPRNSFPWCNLYGCVVQTLDHCMDPSPSHGLNLTSHL